MNNKQFVTICVLLLLFIPATGYSQVQEYVSYKNVLSQKENILKRKVSQDTMIISFVPTAGREYKTLFIRPKGSLVNAVDKSLTLELVRKKSDTSNNSFRIIAYDGENKETKATVYIESKDNILSSMLISIPYSDSTMQWVFTDLRPVFRE